MTQRGLVAAQQERRAQPATWRERAEAIHPSMRAGIPPGLQVIVDGVRGNAGGEEELARCQPLIIEELNVTLSANSADNVELNSVTALRATVAA
jgi:hypothetical protein